MTASTEAADEDSAQQASFTVRPTRQARREDIFQTDKERLWVISQLKLLAHWPLDETQQTRLGSDLDFSKVHYRNESFYELRLDGEHLRQKNLRVFFWVSEVDMTIWIIHAYWKKSNRILESVKTLVARRIKNLRAAIQDGSAQ